MNLRNAHVVVTGASRGIGAEMAKEYASKGARVSLVARNADAIEQLAGQLGGNAFPADLVDSEQVDALIPRIEAEAGPIDVLVNNAGLEIVGDFHAGDADEMRQLLRLNLEAPVVLTRAVLPGMLERKKGHLVYTSSLAGTMGTPGMSVYAGSKAGLSNFVASIRMELRDTPIKTLLVAPGPVDTDMWDHIEAAEGYKAMLDRMNQLHLIPKKTPQAVAKRTVKATESGRRHVRMPRRLTANFVLREVPGRMTESVLAGVKIGPQVDDPS